MMYKVNDRIVQLGLAKKIKNGTSKIVLEKVKEARAAALYALKEHMPWTDHLPRTPSLPKSTQPLQFHFLSNQCRHTDVESTQHSFLQSNKYRHRSTRPTIMLRGTAIL
ncbi:hypothetical protein YC2023_018369 [Brassica napus]